MKKSLFILGLVSLGFLFVGCDSKTSIDEKGLAKKKVVIQTNKNSESQPFKLVTTDGKVINFKFTDEGINFDDYKGNKAILVDVFATWCPPCIAEIPTLIELKNKYKDKFEIVSVLFEQDKPKEEVLEFIKKFGINYPITMGDDNFVLAKELGDIKKVPEMFLFSKEGKFVNKFIGATAKEDLEHFINVAIEN